MSTITIKSGDSKKKITIYSYDTEETVLEKFSISLDDNSLPTYFRTENLLALTNNSTIVVNDIRTEFFNKKTNLDDIIVNADIIKSRYKVEKRELGFLYMMNKKMTEKTFDVRLLELDRYSFATFKMATDRLAEYLKKIQETRKTMSAKFERDSSIGQTLSKIKIKDSASNIFIDSNVIKFYLDTQLPLILMFDRMQPTLVMPFIAIKYNTEILVKTFNSGTLEDDWVTSLNDSSIFLGQQNILVFQVLSIPHSQISKKQIKTKFSLGYIDENNVLVVPFKKPKRDVLTEEEMVKRVFDSIHFQEYFKIEKTLKTDIKCHFIIENEEIDRIVFADLVETDPIIREFIFFDEQDITALNKSRLNAYFSPHQTGDIETSLGIIITPKDEQGKKWLQIRVTHVSNIVQMNACVNTMLILFKIYKDNLEKIRKIYNLVEGSNSSKKDKKTIAYVKKGGHLLDRLKEFEPEMFAPDKGYSRACNPFKQPRILPTEQEKNQVIKEMRDQGLTEEEINDRILNFKNEYSVAARDYTCWGNEKFPYAGLRNYHGRPPKQDPLTVCCFNKHKKVDKRLDKDSDQVQDVGAKYIVGPHHRAEEDRKGDIPIEWLNLLKILDVENRMIGGKDRSPFMRMGVKTSSFSILYCLEKVFNKNYNKNKDVCVNKVRNALIAKLKSDPSFFPLSKQEFYNYEVDDIINILDSNDMYIDPKLFITMLENYYNCNIFVFVKTGLLFEETEMVIPNNQYFHADNNRNFDKSIVIFMYPQDVGESFPFQCELLFEDRDGSDVFFLQKYLVSKLLYIKSLRNQVFVYEDDHLELL